MYCKNIILICQESAYDRCMDRQTHIQIFLSMVGAYTKVQLTFFRKDGYTVTLRSWQRVKPYLILSENRQSIYIVGKIFSVGSKPLKYGLIVLKKSANVIIVDLGHNVNYWDQTRRQIYRCEWCQYVMMDFCSCRLMKKFQASCKKMVQSSNPICLQSFHYI